MRSLGQRVGGIILIGAVAAFSAAAQQVRHTRPDPDSGPTEVVLALAVVDVFGIDDVREMVVIDFVLRATWHDARLAWEPEEGEETILYELHKVWRPRLSIVNEQNLERLHPEVIDVQPDGSVRYQQRFRGDLSTVMDLRDFPFDTQRLPIALVALQQSPEDVRFEIDRSWTLMLESAALSGWRLEMAEPELAVAELPTDDAKLPGVKFIVQAEREAGHVLWTMMVPLVLIILMAWTVFWIDPKFLPSQVGVSTASMFSLIAYRTALRLTLPEVSYVTRADMFILGATLLVFGALAHAVGTGRLAKSGREELALRIDRWARWIYVGLLVVLLVVSMSW